MLADFANTTKTATTAVFTWTKASGATSVKIQQSPHSTNTWTDATTEPALVVTSETGTVTGLIASTAYDFKLVVVGGVNAGDSNVVVNITTNAE